MTAAGTAVGMLLIALEWAVGLERLNPLAVVAIGGLVVSTFLTLIYVPLTESGQVLYDRSNSHYVGRTCLLARIRQDGWIPLVTAGDCRLMRVAR